MYEQVQAKIFPTSMQKKINYKKNEFPILKPKTNNRNLSLSDNKNNKNSTENMKPNTALVFQLKLGRIHLISPK